MRTMPQQKPGKSRQDYSTPADFIAAVKQLLGITEFAHDFAAHRRNTKARTWFGPGSSINENAMLVTSWAKYCSVGFGWLNPEFANITPWARRCSIAKRAGGNIAFLVPAAVGSDWYRDHVHGQALVLALNGRLAFIEGQPDWLYPKDCVLALYSSRLEPGFDVWSWRLGERRLAA